MDFEWDAEKAAANLKKHSVSFGDVLSLTFANPDHSDDEQRFITMGQSDFGRVLVVAHTNRGDRIRIISAREATRAERKTYEEET